MVGINQESIKLKRNHWGNYNVNQWIIIQFEKLPKNNNNKERRKGGKKSFSMNSEICESFITVRN